MFYAPHNLTINEECREWLECSMGWLQNNFREAFTKEIITPESGHFNIHFSGEYNDAENILQVLLPVMDIDPEEVELGFYMEGEKQVGSGTGRVFLNADEGQKFSGGLYHGKHEDGKYHVSLNIGSLNDPNILIATLTHELAHIKLLGEKRIKINNEHLTDLTTVVFGLGIFNSTAAFKYERQPDSWSYSTLGYLSQMEWGYALALYALLRGEENPEWLRFLPIDVEADFKRAMAFMLENRHLVMNEEFIGDEIPPHPVEAQKIAEGPPVNHEALNRQYQDEHSAYLLAKQNPVEAARQIYERFENSDTSAYIIDLGIGLHMDLKQYDKAEKLFVHFEQTHTLDERQLYNAGVLYAALNKHEKAADYYQQAVDINPFYLEALNNLGFQLSRLERYEEAIAVFDELIDYEPGYVYAWNNRAYAKIKSGNGREGLRDVQYALKMQDDQAYSHRVLGIYYLEENNKVEALKHFATAKSLDPNVDDINELIEQASK